MTYQIPQKSNNSIIKDRPSQEPLIGGQLFLNFDFNDSKIEWPNRTNNRTLEQIIKAFPSFKNTIIDYIDEQIKQWSEISVIDIGTGQWHILEELKAKDRDKIYAHGIGKYPERKQNLWYKEWLLQAKYHEIEIIDRLPNDLPDNKVDIIFSFHSIQYIKKLFHVLQSVHQKLKPGWIAFINAGQITAIDPELLKEFINDNFGNQITLQYDRGGQRNIIIKKILMSKLKIPEYESELWEYIIKPEIIKDTLWKYTGKINTELLESLITYNAYLKGSNENIRNYAYTYFRRQAFTLIEILLVITIIGILSAITLHFNRWAIKDMEAMNDREQRSSRHRKENNIITNTNFINQQKITTGIQFIYSGGNNSVYTMISGEYLTWYTFKNHYLSGNLTITKKPLQLWCSSTDDNHTIELIWPNKKISCFILNTHICSRTSCE